MEMENEAIRNATESVMNYVACIKSGEKYGPDYVNVLFNMVKRNLSIDFRFVCFTDNKTGIENVIQTYPLPYPGLSGWWNKIALFRSGLPIAGTVLFLDLDVVIIGNIDSFFKYEPNKFIMLEDLSQRLDGATSLRRIARRVLNRIRGVSIFCSGVFRFETNNSYFIWEKYLKYREEIEKKYHGDQDWISECVRNVTKIWPEKWVMSYKWEIAGDFDKNNPPTYYRPRTKLIPKDCSIVVFHGKPDPEDVMDQPIMIQHYL
jgi:hypothetical protein